MLLSAFASENNISLLHDSLHETVSKSEGRCREGVGDRGLDVIIIVLSEPGLLGSEHVLVHVVHP